MLSSFTKCWQGDSVEAVLSLSRNGGRVLKSRHPLDDFFGTQDASFRKTQNGKLDTYKRFNSKQSKKKSFLFVYLLDFFLGKAAPWNRLNITRLSSF